MWTNLSMPFLSVWVCNPIEISGRNADAVPGSPNHSGEWCTVLHCPPIVIEQWKVELIKMFHIIKKKKPKLLKTGFIRNLNFFCHFLSDFLPQARWKEILFHFPQLFHHNKIIFSQQFHWKSILFVSLVTTASYLGALAKSEEAFARSWCLHWSPPHPFAQNFKKFVFSMPKETVIIRFVLISKTWVR